jgi:hypothetical protein
VKLHRVECRSCDGHGETRLCRCSAGRYASPLARVDLCSCEADECEECGGRGTILCDEPDCETCEEMKNSLAESLRRAAQGGAS